MDFVTGQVVFEKKLNFVVTTAQLCSQEGRDEMMVGTAEGSLVLLEFTPSNEIEVRSELEHVLNSQTKITNCLVYSAPQRVFLVSSHLSAQSFKFVAVANSTIKLIFQYDANKEGFSNRFHTNRTCLIELKESNKKILMSGGDDSKLYQWQIVESEQAQGIEDMQFV